VLLCKPISKYERLSSILVFNWICVTYYINQNQNEKTCHK